VRWETLYCPHRDCRCYGKTSKAGLLVKNGNSRGESQSRCNAWGFGSRRTWRPVTPAMAAGMTDHVWTINELLSYRVSTAFLPQLRAIEHLFPS
jgi:hypothetical protein